MFPLPCSRSVILPFVALCVLISTTYANNDEDPPSGHQKIIFFEQNNGTCLDVTGGGLVVAAEDCKTGALKWDRFQQNGADVRLTDDYGNPDPVEFWFKKESQAKNYPPNCFLTYDREGLDFNRLVFNELQTKHECSMKKLQVCLCTLTCQAGTYQDEENQKSCKSCEINTFSIVGRSSCEYNVSTCPLGTYANNQTYACTKCGPGSYGHKIGIASQDECQKCGPGTYSSKIGSVSSTDCKNCEIGMYSTEIGLKKITDCSSCTQGRYNDKMGQTKCTNCVAGKYNEDLGSKKKTDCTGCKKGKHGSKKKNTKKEKDQCSFCKKGMYNDVTGQTECKPCKKGTYSGSTGAVKACKGGCKAGNYITADASACVKCNPGFMSRDDATIGGNCEYGGCRPIGTENAPCICGSDGKDDNGSPTQQCDGDNDYWCPEGMGPSGVLDPICSPKCEYTKGTVYNELVKGQISCACGLNGCNNVTGLFCTEDSSLCSERRSSCNEGMTAETAVNCEVITERCTCSKCKEGYFSAICEKCTAGEDELLMEGTFIVIEASIGLFLIFLLFSLLYFAFRSSSDDKPDSKKSKAQEAKDNKMKKGARAGSSMSSVLVNQMQIVGVILGRMTFSDIVPWWLRGMVMLLTSFMSFDVSVLFRSPECVRVVENAFSVDLSVLIQPSPILVVQSLDPIDKWWVKMLLPWILIVFFLLWFSSARCHFKFVRHKYDPHVVQTILHAGIYITLTCLYTTVVKICFSILDCTPIEITSELDSDGQNVTIPAMLIMDSRFKCEDLVLEQTVGGIVFLIWCVLPFLIIWIQLCRHRLAGTIEISMRENANFRHMFGWALKKYRLNNPVAYLWEIVNATLKVFMVAGSELMYAKNRFIVHLWTCVVSTIIHIAVRPFKDIVGNIIVVIFNLIQLIGIMSEDPSLAIRMITASDTEEERLLIRKQNQKNKKTKENLQFLFIILILAAIIIVLSLAAAAGHSAAKAMRENGMDHHHKHFTKLETILLTPLMICLWLPKKCLMLFSLLDWCLSQEDSKELKKSRRFERHISIKNGTKVVPEGEEEDGEDDDSGSDNEDEVDEWGNHPKHGKGKKKKKKDKKKEKKLKKKEKKKLKKKKAKKKAKKAAKKAKKLANGDPAPPSKEGEDEDDY